MLRGIFYRLRHQRGISEANRPIIYCITDKGKQTDADYSGGLPESFENPHREDGETQIISQIIMNNSNHKSNKSEMV